MEEIFAKCCDGKGKQIDWRTAMSNVLPWIEEEMEKNGHKESLGKFGRRKSITIPITVLLDRMGLVSEDKRVLTDRMGLTSEYKRALMDRKMYTSVWSFRNRFRRYIIGKGFDVRIGKVDKEVVFVIMEKQHSGCDTETVKQKIEETVKQKIEKEYTAKYSHISASEYDQRSDVMFPFIKEMIDNSEDGIYVVSIKNPNLLLGHKFEAFKGGTIIKNLKIAMEKHNIVVGEIDNDKFVTFRYKKEGEQLVWEREGFISREEYEECLKDEGNCRRNKKIVNESKSEDPNSLFNNRNFIKKIFAKCDVDDTRI